MTVSVEVGTVLFDEGGIVVGDKGVFIFEDRAVAPVEYKTALDDIRDATVSPPDLKAAIPLTSLVIIFSLASPFIPGMPKMSAIPALIAAVGLIGAIIIKWQPSVIILRTSKGQVKVLKGQDKSFLKRVANAINEAKRGTNAAGASARGARA